MFRRPLVPRFAAGAGILVRGARQVAISHIPPAGANVLSEAAWKKAADRSAPGLKGHACVGCGHTLEARGTGPMRLELTNHEALHGWGVVNNSADWHAQRNRKPPVAEQAVGDILFRAYNCRTDSTTTVELSDEERASLAELVSEHIAAWVKRGRPNAAAPHLRSLVVKLGG